jgi:iron(III) transport system permease protein
LTALLLWLVGYPLLITLIEALRSPLGGFSLETFSTFAQRGEEWLALWRSLWLSVASVVAAAALGIPLAFLFARWDFRGRRLLTALLTLPVSLPPLVGVLAFLFLYGESGLITRLVGGLLGTSEAPWRLQGWPAILLVHAYSMYVYFFLFARAALLATDPSQREAAASLGAGRWRILREVTLPALRPALLGAGLLTFLTSMASFSAPYLFGGSFRVMTTQIVASKLNGNLRLAMVESVALAAVAFFALVVSRRWGGGSVVAVSHGVAAYTAPPLTGFGRWVVPALAWGFALILLLPHAVLILLSLVPTATWTVEFLPPVLDLSNYRAFFTDARRIAPVISSAWMATLASAAALVLGFLAANLGRQQRGRWRGVLEGMVVLPWAIPGTVFAVALAVTFSVDQPWAGRFLLIGTTWILPLAYLLRTLPLTGRAAIAGLSQLDPAQEEAASALGAGRWRSLWRVTLPQVRPALAAGLALAFITSLGDFVTSIILYTYENRPIAIEIYSNLRLQEIGLASVYGVLLMLLSTVVLFTWGEGRKAGAI